MELKNLIKRAMEIREKYAQFEKDNTGREWNNLEKMAGFVGDVGDLQKLIMAKEGRRKDVANVDEKLAHELSDCLWCVFVLAKGYGIDIEKEFMKTMDELEERIKSKI
ncbi:MAG: MazG nucleotide pyrophosphohydrolase domain-containing protein [bacterium]